MRFIKVLSGLSVGRNLILIFCLITLPSCTKVSSRPLISEISEMSSKSVPLGLEERAFLSSKEGFRLVSEEGGRSAYTDTKSKTTFYFSEGRCVSITAEELDLISPKKTRAVLKVNFSSDEVERILGKPNILQEKGRGPQYLYVYDDISLRVFFVYITDFSVFGIPLSTSSVVSRIEARQNN